MPEQLSLFHEIHNFHLTFHVDAKQVGYWTLQTKEWDQAVATAAGLSQFYHGVKGVDWYHADTVRMPFTLKGRDSFGRELRLVLDRTITYHTEEGQQL